jgi:HAD superfamily hydrolase (TIGR01549 family)
MIERPGRWLAAFRRRALLAEIEAFRSAGGRTALVSDYPARRKLEALGASALFDAVVASGEPGGPRRLKPHPDGYLRAAELLEVEPVSCLVIGDRDDADGEAARAAGMAFRRIR